MAVCENGTRHSTIFTDVLLVEGIIQIFTLAV